MDVVVCAQPGELKLEQRPEPVRGEREVLVRIRRVGVCGTDMHIFSGNQPYLSYPRVMGHELSGEVVEAPSGNDLQPGDPVYIIPYISCGSCVACRKGKDNCCTNIGVLGVHRDGGLAQYLSVPERFVRSAKGITLDQAAMLEFLAIGAHAVRRGNPGKGDKVLVVGAGPIGIGVALFAKLRGAEVAVIDGREDRLAFCREKIGVAATFAIGETMRDELAAHTGGDFFDVVFDATGNPKAMEAGFLYVAHGGAYVLVSIVASEIRFSDPEFHKREMTLIGSRNALKADFDHVAASIRNGAVPLAKLVTHRTTLAGTPHDLARWAHEKSGLIKAVIEIG